MKKRFDQWLAVKVTDAVSTMNCAYIFALLAAFSLPEAIRGGVATMVSWTAQTFLQLVLLSVIMVGQKAQADHTIELKKHVKKIHTHLGIEEEKK